MRRADHGARPWHSLGRLTRGRGWAVLGLAALAVLGLAQTGLGRSALERADAAGPGAGYTELALEQTTARPAGGRRLDVTLDVAIGNARAERNDGTWRLELRAATLVSGTGEGAVALAPGADQTLRVVATVRCAKGAEAAFVGVRVDPSPGRSVGSWVACPEAAR